MPNSTVVPVPAPHKDISDWITATNATKQTIEELCKNPPAPPEPTNEPQDVKSEVTHPESEILGHPDVKLKLTELASAHRLAHRHAERLRHSSEVKWLVWDGKQWKRSEKAAQRLASEIGQVVRDEARFIQDPQIAKYYYAHANKLESDYGIYSVLNLAKSLEPLDGDRVEWDANPYLLNTPNGTVDLLTGDLHSHRREDYLTKMCPTQFDMTAQCIRWVQFLGEIFCGDTDLIRYFNWLCWYFLTGSTQHHIFPIAYGVGSNGKTTLLRILQHVLGDDYAQQINPDILMLHRDAQHPTDLAMLCGVRLAIGAETAEGRRINESQLKMLTGGDKVRARFMRCDSFEFVPTMKLILATNWRPRIKDDSYGLWRRIRLLPFEASFPANKADTSLLETLKAEAPGILSWCLCGREYGIDREPEPPERVQVATTNYQHEQDTTAQFVEEMCEQWPEATVTKSDLYRAYSTWSGGRCESAKVFSQRFAARGIQEVRLHGGQRAWKGISLQINDLQRAGDTW